MMVKRRREILRSRDILITGPNEKAAIDVYNSLQAQLEQLQDYSFDPVMYMEQPPQTRREYRTIPGRGVAACLHQKNGVKAWQVSLNYICIDQLTALTNLFSTMVETSETIVLLCLDQDFLSDSFHPFRPLNDGPVCLYNFELHHFCDQVSRRARLIRILCGSTLNAKPLLEITATFSGRIMPLVLTGHEERLSHNFIGSSGPFIFSKGLVLKNLLK
ncbi:hypothetical protein LZD49_10070 [Dyadobacter sp. CY261]|uniref:hypothetical protein n=1 Tax=Dyadobacter sp. CY261 TaxID=2907203 RepID=UPI001F488592|nr:hypothetical protein [Dyadobacter sp. CY261]MCF0070818.1 hypothetical protein [Dyadobacter sp. CY261]